MDSFVHTFLQQLAKAKAKNAPTYLRRSTEFAYYRRWSRMLAVSASSAFAASLILDSEHLHNDGPFNGSEPLLEDVLAEAPHDDPVGPSRLI